MGKGSKGKGKKGKCKKGKGKKDNNPVEKSQPSISAIKEEKKQEEINNIVKECKITEEELDSVVVEAEELNITSPDKAIDELLKQSIKLKKSLDKRLNKAETLVAENNSQKEKIAEDALDQEQKYQEKLAVVDKKLKEIDSNKIEIDKQLKKYDEKLSEVNALRKEAGFSSIIDKKILDEYTDKQKEHEELLLEKIEEISQKNIEYIKLLSELSLKEIELEKNQSEILLVKKKELEDCFTNKFKQKENELEQLEKEFEEQERKLKKREKKLNYEIEDFEYHKSFLEEKARKKVQDEINTSELKIEDLRKKNKMLNDNIADLEDKLQYFGSRNPKDILGDLRNKEKEIHDLQEKLALKPDALKVDELKQLRREKTDWETKLRDLEAQVNDYKARYENQKLQIGEKERLEFQKEQLEQRIKLQQEALKDLTEEVDSLTEQSQAKQTFVNCSEMDIKYMKGKNKTSTNKISKTWIKNLQQAIAQVTENKLYYDLKTIRSFVAGLSMSRFSILQGISGTGKTSLPKAFAKAIGGNFGIVEVQSGWKDKQDLIGYYNTFEKKYYEGKFLKYLYMANTPAFRDKPFFIILDEMNLSHPEHYFADILSLMEETDKSKQILSISDKVKDRPKHMLELTEGGIGLKIPDNVWFIGTANHDETTLQFAPKTYDRSNIMEMPKNIDRFDIKSIEQDNLKLSNYALLDHFNRHTKNAGDGLTHMKEYLNNSDFKTICNKLGLGWGNRLDKQIENFVPVFSSLGGSEAEALDHIISSKILRNIKGRYDLQEKILVEMQEELTGKFVELFKNQPKNSLEIIKVELERLG